MTELVVIRHGETDLNKVGSFQGHIDVPLNARGRSQAARLAQRLAGERFDIIYSSDLLRAQQTAQPIAERLSMTVNPVGGLREQYFGELEGLSLQTVQTRFPDVWQTWLGHRADYAVPGGESVRQFSARTLATVYDLARRHDGQRLLVIAHGGVLDMLYRQAQAQPLDGPRLCAIPNTGVNRLRVDGEILRIELWGDADHAID